MRRLLQKKKLPRKYNCSALTPVQRSLEFAIQAEAEWDLIKPKEDEDDDDEEEE